MQFTQRQCGFLYGKGGTKNDCSGSISALTTISINAERCGLRVWVFSLALTCSVGIESFNQIFGIWLDFSHESPALTPPRERDSISVRKLPANPMEAA
jgi:hypothetical protein